jgi:hypothetical protein
MIRELESIRAQIAVGTMALTYILDSQKRLGRNAHLLAQAEVDLLRGCSKLDEAIEEMRQHDAANRKLNDNLCNCGAGDGSYAELHADECAVNAASKE